MKEIRPLSQTSLITDANLQAYWTLDGDARDYKNTYNGSSSGVSFDGQYGLFGQGGYFNGVNSYINYGDVLDIGTGDFSVNCWIKITTVNATMSPISKSSARGQAGRWAIYFQTSDSTIHVLMEGTAGNTYDFSYSYTSIIDGKWHLISAVFIRTSNAILYIDGVQVASTSISAANGQNLNGVDPLYIGAYGNSTGTAPGYFFIGSIDDVSIFNRALSQQDITNIYAKETFINNRPLSQTRFNSDSGLVGYWKLDGNSSDSKNGYNGTDTAITYGNQYGVFGQGASFNGSSSLITISDNASLKPSGAYTISQWVKINGKPTSGNYYLFNSFVTSPSSMGILTLIQQNTGFFALDSYTSGTEYYLLSTTNVCDGIWHHIVATYDGSGATGAKVYVDGILEKTSTSWATQNYNTTNYVRIGAFYNGSTNLGYFNGNIDEVALFNRALGAIEVQELYAKEVLRSTFRPLFQTRFVNDDNLIAYWKQNADGNDSKGGFNLTNTLVSYVEGGFSNVALYNGVTSISTTTGISNQLNRDCTFSCWAKINSLGGNGGVGMLMCSNVASYSNYFMALYAYNNAGVYRFDCYKYDGTSNPGVAGSAFAISLNTWYHVAGVIRGTTIELYVNGNLIGTATDSTTSIPVYSGFTLGGQTSQTRYLNGAIQDAAVFNRALLREEIVEIYQKPQYNEYLPITLTPQRGLIATSLFNDANLVSYWRFDGNYLDSKGTNNGSAISISGYGNAYGKFNQGIYSAGGSVNRSLTIPSSVSLISPTTGLTVSIWVNVTSLVAQTVPLSMRYLPDPTSPYNAYLFDIETTSLTFGVNTANGYGSASINMVFPTNTWQHLIGTYDGSTVKLYLNGILTGSGSITGAINYGSSRELRIADNYYNAGQFYTGYIDDVALFSRALSAAEVFEIYSKGESSSLRPLEAIYQLNSDSGLVGYWKLDGNANDSKGSNNGTATSITYTSGVNGRFGQCGVFNGSSSYVDCGNSASLQLTSGTISAWIKTSGAGSSHRGIVVKQNAFGMFLLDNVFCIFDWSGGGTKTSSVNLADGKWHHVAVTLQSGVSNGTILYIDGTSRTTTTFTVSNQTVQLVIGNGGTSGTAQNFNGLIEDVCVFNRVLTSSEIFKLYNGDSTVGHWKLNGNSTDYSGNGLHGTDSNMTYGDTYGNGSIGGIFNGTSSMITTGLNPSTRLGKNFTISAWIYPTEASNYRGVGGNHNGSYQGIIFFQNDTGSWYCSYGSGSAFAGGVSTKSILINQWNHVLCVYQVGVSLTMYVNGALTKTSTETIGISHLTEFWIGRAFNSTDRYFKGNIDDFIVDNKIWTTADVKKYYERTVGKYIKPTQSGIIKSGLVTLLQPSDLRSYPTTGTAYYDLSGKGNNVTVGEFNFSTNNGGVFNNATARNGAYGLSYPLTNFPKRYGTLEIWAKPTSWNASNGLFVNRNDSTENALDWFWMGVWDNANYFYLRIGDGSTCCNNDLSYGGWSGVHSLNTWGLYTATWYAGLESKIYFNGVLKGTRTSLGVIPATNPSANGRFGIGHNNVTNSMWLGDLGGIAIYDRILNAAEVAHNFDTNKARYGL